MQGWMADLRRVAIYGGSFIGPLAGNAVLALVPILKSEYHATGPQVLLSITFFMLPFAVSMLFTGTLSDIYGRRKALTLGYVIYALGGFCTAFSPDLSTFYMSRALQGFGFAFVSPVLVALLGDIVDPKETGRAMGLLGAATTAGIALGPFMAGFISQVDWRLTFITISILSLFMNVLYLVAFKGHLEVKKDRKGTGAFATLMKEALGERKVITLSLAGFMTFLCYMSTLAFMSDVLSLPPLSLAEDLIGIAIASAGIAGIFMAPVGGWLVDNLGRLKAAMIGFGIMMVAFLVLTRADSFPTYSASLALLGCGSSVVWASLLTLTVEVMPRSRGTVSSIFNSSRFLGYAVAPVLFGPVYVSLGMDSIQMIGVFIATLALIAPWLTVRAISPRVVGRPNPPGPR